MKSYSLSPRLKVIANFAKGKKTVADIGCDHGKISIYLAETGSYVYAVDISEPSLNKARELAKTEGVTDRMKFYCDDGLESVKNVDIDAAIIAGMGWRMIKSIIENNIETVKLIDTFIFQPMDNVVELRNYISQNNFAIIDEKLVWDEGRLYTVIAAKYGNSQQLSMKGMLIGPKILENKDDLTGDLIEKELTKRNKILDGLKKAKSKDIQLIKKTEIEIFTLIQEIKRYGLK